MNIIKNSFLLCCIFMCTLAYSVAIEKAEDILIKSKEAEDKTSYIATAPDRKVISYQKVNKDGSVLKATEHYSDDRKTVTFITNADGIFEVSPEQVVQKNYLLKRKSYILDRLTPANVVLNADQQVNSVLCYVVATHYEPNDVAFKEFVQTRTNDRTEQKQLFEKRFPVLKIYYIGKDDFILRKSELFNALGDMISFEDKGIVEITENFPQDTFVIPTDRPLIVADDIGQYVDGISSGFVSQRNFDIFQVIRYLIIGIVLLITLLIIILVIKRVKK